MYDLYTSKSTTKYQFSNIKNGLTVKYMYCIKMGNCIVIEQHIEYGCGVCNSDLGMRYIYCPYCHKRFHNRCIVKYKTKCKVCPECKHDYLRFIDKELPRNKI